MIFTDQMKNLKVYRKPMFLPTLENDKKNGSSVLLLTPNYESSKALMSSPLLINRLRYQAYYAERDLTRFLSSKLLDRVKEAAILESSYPDNIPQDIIDFNKELNSKYQYGVIKNGKIITGNELEYKFDFFNDYRSLSVSEFEKYRTGVCWDYVHYEAKWFKDHGYKYETYYIEVNDGSGDCPTHTFLVFYLPNSTKVYYFESSWYQYRGIEEFNDINSLLKTVKDRHSAMSKDNMPETAFHVKFDAGSASFEHIGCADYMKKASKGKTYLEESSSVILTEYNLFINRDHIIYHPEGIQAGTKNNIMFVTGYSGGGKSTYANEYEGFHNTHVIHGDDFYMMIRYYNRGIGNISSSAPSYKPRWDINTEECKRNIGDMMYNYLKNNISTMLVSNDKFSNPELATYWEDFMIWLQKESQTPKYKKDLFIVEGIQIYITNPELYKDYTIVIMGTSMKTSWWRKASRDIFQPGKYDWKHIKTLFTTMKMCLNSSKDIDSFISKLNESTTEKDSSKFDWNVHKATIEKKYGIIVDKRYNACIKLKGYKPLRGRSEVLIVNDQDQVYLTKGKWGPYDYELPGGSWDDGEDPMQCAIRETMEEARIKIKDVTEYLPYVAKYEPDDWQNEHIPKDMQWYGDYNQLYIARYNGYYDGPIEKEDRDDKMVRKGRFYDIKEVKNLLDPGHLTALEAYLYRGLGDEFIEDDIEANSLLRKADRIQESTNMVLSETPLQSALDKDFKQKGYKSLSSFKKVPINKRLIDKYKDRSKILIHQDPRDKGYFFLDGDKPVAVIAVDDRCEDSGDLKYYNMISCVEVFPEYRGYGLSKQLLDIAVNELGAEMLTVAYDNEVAINLYKSYGFKISKSSYERVKYHRVPYDKFSSMYTMFYKIKPGDNIKLIDESCKDIISARKLSWSDDITNMDNYYLKENLDREILNKTAIFLNKLPKYRLYRFTYNGEGIYEAFRKHVTPEVWNKFLKSGKAKWLKKPPEGTYDNKSHAYDYNSYKSYFTRDGYKKFKEITLPEMKKYLDKDKIKVSTTNRDELYSKAYAVYTDKYQVIYGFLNESFIFENYDLLHEDSRYDAKLKSLLYNDRIKQRKAILELNKQVKADLPFIKFIYPEFEKYKNKNLFMDFYYYNEIFFKNNDWNKQRGFDLYLDLLERLLTDTRLDKAGYKKKTIFIPVLDWNKPNTKIWMYKETINPISIIYELLYKKSDKLIEIFKKNDVIFFGQDKYFKLNFSQIEEDFSKVAMKFKMFISKLVAGQEFDLDDIDTSLEVKETPEAIKANIIDKIEASKGIDLTGKDAAVKKRAKGDNESEDFVSSPINSKSQKASEKPLPSEEVEKQDAEKKMVKGTDDSVKKKNEKELEQLAIDIDKIANSSADTEEAIDRMDSLKSVLIDLDSMRDDSPKIDSARSARMNKLDQQFLDQKIKGKSVRDILEEDVTKKEIKKTTLDIATPNDEWKDLTYMNFDKDYDLDRDIVACLKHFQTVSNPISIRNIDVTNNSTSEDRVNLYTVEMEDARGKRFTIKFDVPIMVDNRFLLRGNDKSINTQLCNMPIIKTDLDACQIITNYQKVFVYRVNNLVAGRSLPITGRLLKAISKYEGKNIKFTFGDNTKISNKYELPMDYIDIASVVNKIDTPNFLIYFNQDEIRSDYPEIDDTLGVPCLISKKDKKVKYFTIDQYNINCFTSDILFILRNEDSNFGELFDKATEPTSGTYSRCNIMSSKIPMIVVLGYMEGLTKTLKKANINFVLVESLTKEIRAQKDIKNWIKFKDGYLVYDMGYESCLLLNGFKECSTELYSIYDVDSKNIYTEMLDNFGGRIKADGLDNFYDCLIDPITKEILEHYNLPTDVVSVFLYANMLLSDNKFTKHTDISSRRIRRNELVAAYGYEALSESYGLYSNQMKHNPGRAEFIIKQSVIIDKILTSPISSDDSTINALRDLETTNGITSKGKAGLNSERAYSLDKRTYDNSMINVLGASTGFSGNTGITRQTTMDMNVEGYRGYIKITDGDTSKMNTAKTMTATEALVPFGSTRDDGMRVAMTFIQTAKHALRTEEADPLLVTSGADEAMVYMTTDKFAFKAKHNGVIKELTEDYIIVEYDNGTKDFINLKERVMKNSDGGHYVPLKLDAMEGLKAGKKIKENDILAYDKLSFSNSVGESDNLAYNIGKLAKVAIINTDEGYEDSGVTVETMSEKLASRIVLKEDRNISKDATIFSMVKVGDRVEVNDALLVWQDPYEEEDANILLKALAADQEEVSELGRRTIRSETSGRITQINIYRTVELDELSDSLRKIVVNYEKDIKALKKKLDAEGIDSSGLPATYKLEATGKLKNAQDAVKIEIFVEYKDVIAVGDKITYNSANKAVTKTIIPKDLAPYTDFRPNEPIDAFVSEVSIDKRMVGSIMVYGSLQKLMIELDRTCKDMAGIPYDDSTI